MDISKLIEFCDAQTQCSGCALDKLCEDGGGITLADVAEFFRDVQLTEMDKIATDWLANAPHITYEERVFLNSICEPMKDKIQYVVKRSVTHVPLVLPEETKLSQEYISILFKIDGAEYRWYTNLYPFEKGTQFQGMKLDKYYTLADLGLE